MKKTALTFAATAIFSLIASGADIYNGVLEEVERHAPALEAARARLESARAENATGLAPADPEVEVGYLWGNPSDIGARKDVSVTQEFDFPTVYSRRRALARSSDADAAGQYRCERQNVLFQAQLLCIDLIYANANAAMCALHLDNARRMASAYGRMLQAGHTTRLEANKATLALAAAEAMTAEALSERESLLERLRIIAGTDSLQFTAAAYPREELPESFDSLFNQAIAADARLSTLVQAQETAARREDLAKALRLPRFSVGYQGEFVRGEGFQGIKVGLVVPLWQNRGKVKAAQTAAVASALEYSQAEADMRAQYLESYNRAVRLHSALESMRALVENADNSALLREALAKGEISLLAYLDELEFMHQAQLRLLDTEREYARAMAVLNAHRL